MIGREDEVRHYRDRVKSFHLIIFLSFALIGVRLFYLQVLKGDDLRKYSEANRLKKEKLFPTRGVVYDRNGRVIVDNRASFDVVVVSQYYTSDSETNQRLAHALDMDQEDLEKRLQRANKGPRFAPVLLRSDVSKDIIAAIEMDAKGFPGVDIEANVQRRYPFKEISAHLLGFVGEVDTNDLQHDKRKTLESGDNIGKMGLERIYDNYLRGINGVGYVEVDALGRRRKQDRGGKLLGFIAQTEPLPGDNVHLTLDMDLEQTAAEAMKARKFSGSVVAIDPRNGEVLVMLNYPAYDPEIISSREVSPKIWTLLKEDKEQPLINRAIQEHYPPGSTFKLFLAMAGLGEGTVTPKLSINCTGGIQFGSRRFNCWKKHGVVDFVRAIKESCDTYFYKLGIQLGVDSIAKYARYFGLGSKTEIKLSNEQRGLIPDTAWKLSKFQEPWYPGETPSVAIGQGYVTVTPLQLALAYAAIGNGGFLYRPFILRKIEGRAGEMIKENQPELIRKIELPTEVFTQVKEGLYRVLNEPGGTAFASRSAKVMVSGKTGTSQVRGFGDITKIKQCSDLPLEHRHHGWFVGYAPRENPEIAVAVLTEHSCHGSSAAPVVRDVIERYFLTRPIPPDQVPPNPFKKVVVKETPQSTLTSHSSDGNRKEDDVPEKGNPPDGGEDD